MPTHTPGASAPGEVDQCLALTWARSSEPGGEGEEWENTSVEAASCLVRQSPNPSRQEWKAGDGQVGARAGTGAFPCLGIRSVRWPSGGSRASWHSLVRPSAHGGVFGLLTHTVLRTRGLESLKAESLLALFEMSQVSAEAKFISPLGLQMIFLSSPSSLLHINSKIQFIETAEIIFWPANGGKDIFTSVQVIPSAWYIVGA